MVLYNGVPLACSSLRSNPIQFTGKFYMVGPGGYELKLSPGSEVFETEDSKAGHMMLPCSQFKDANRQQNREDAQTFLVGDYFAPTEPRAALQCLPGSRADTNTELFLRDALDELDALAGSDSL